MVGCPVRTRAEHAGCLLARRVTHHAMSAARQRGIIGLPDRPLTRLRETRISPVTSSRALLKHSVTIVADGV
jgi:hypothetical protein